MYQPRNANKIHVSGHPHASVILFLGKITHISPVLITTVHFFSLMFYSYEEDAAMTYCCLHRNNNVTLLHTECLLSCIFLYYSQRT